jgi:hypothetical protein
MLSDERLQDLLAQLGQAFKSPALVLSHEARVSDDVSGKYGCEPALHGRVPL